MSEYMWGVTRNKISDRRARRYDKIAREVGGPGCGFVWGVFPGEGWKGWFYAPNLGHPFDRATQTAIEAAIAAEFPTPVTYDVRAPGCTAWSTHRKEFAARREYQRCVRRGFGGGNLRVFRHNSDGSTDDITTE